MLSGIIKPEYLYRPSQLLARLTSRKKTGHTVVRLPWGSDICVSANDNVGGQIVALGLYDLVITETLWRLCDVGESALDVGANIGYTTFVMAERLGPGSIQCFEPHPIIHQELIKNIHSLQDQGSKTQFRTCQFALGPVAGKLPLFVPKDFEYHRGESSLTAPQHLECSSEQFLVEVVTLDSRLQAGESIGVMKLDVEGFELEVLKGAEKSFNEKTIRDCVFEEHELYPTPVTNWFESKGYEVFRLDRSFWGPQLLPGNSLRPRTNWTATNFLATADPQRVRQRFAASGWQCLRGKSAS